MNLRSLWAGLALGVVVASGSAASAQVVISQFWGGGSTTGAAPADAVELFNRGTTPIDLSGWSIHVATATGTAWTRVPIVGTSTTVIQPKGYYFVRVATGTSTNANGVEFDAISTAADILVSTGGKIALVDASNTGTLTGASPIGDTGTYSPPVNGIHDFVGYGTTANGREAPTLPGVVGNNAPPNSFTGPTAVKRRGDGCLDSNLNSADFVTTTPIVWRNTLTTPGQNVNSLAVTPSTTMPVQGGSVTITSSVTNCEGVALATTNASVDLSAFGLGTVAMSSDNGITYTTTFTVPMSQAIGNANAIITGNGAYGTLTQTVVLTVGAAPPTNDECATATTLPGPGLYSFNNVSTTTSANSPLPGCLGSTTPMAMNNDIWYRYVAPASGRLSSIARTASTPTPPSTRAAIYDGGTGGGACPAAGASPLNCQVTPGLVTADVVAGNVYFIQIASTTLGTTGVGNFELNFVPTAQGKCCVGSACSITSQQQCVAGGGTYSGDNTVCSAPTGLVGTYTGAGGAIPDGSATAPGVFTNAISVSDSGSVANVEVDINFSHTWTGDLIITLSNGAKTIDILNRAARGRLLGTATTPSIVGTSNNIGTGANTAAAALNYTFADSAMTEFWSTGTDVTGTSFAVGAYHPFTTGGILTSFRNTFNGQPIAGTWTLRVTDNAGVDTGTVVGWTLRLVQGDAPTCSAPATVTCCRGTICYTAAPADCVSGTAGTGPNGAAGPIVGASITSAASCNAGANPTSPCCLADFTKSSGVNIDDIFIFLNAWFGQSPFAKVGGNGTAAPNIDDIFLFLNNWFASGGCVQQP